MSSGAAGAVQPLPERIEWICGLEAPRAESVRCELQEPVPGYYASADYGPPDAPRIRADLFRRGADTHVTRLVREAPERYAGESWWIPLHAPPTDMARVRELAESVMCGNDRACRVTFSGAAVRTAALDAPR